MNIGTTVIKREISPFKPGFFVLRILVNETHIALIVSKFFYRKVIVKSWLTDDVYKKKLMTL